MSGRRFSSRRRLVVAAVLLLALLGIDRVSVWAASRAGAQAAPCDPATAEGCPLTLGAPHTATLVNGTDVHTFGIDVPAEGEIGIVIETMLNAAIKTDLDLYLYDSRDQLVKAGLTEDSPARGLRRGESVQAHVQTGSYYVIVQVKASSNREVRDAPYTIRLLASSEVWAAALAPSNGRIVAAHPHFIRKMVLSSDGRTLVTSSSDRTVSLWRTTDGQPLGSVPIGTDAVWDVALSPDSRLLATVSSGRVLTIWNLASSQPELTISGLRDQPVAVAFSPDSQTVATVSATFWERTTSVMVHRVADGALIRSLDLPGLQPDGLVFSPDGQFVATVSSNEAVLIRVDGSTVVRRLPGGSQQSVRRVAFSPDGQLLASTSLDKTARLWRLADGALVQTLVGHQEGVFGIAFSPDGQLLATGSTDGTLRLWRVADGAQVQMFGGLGDSLYDVAYGPDGRFIVTSGGDGTARRWDLSP